MLLTKKVLGVVMGGGRGTRLHPLTKERCKPAVPLAGKYRLVDIPISNCLNSGINRIFLLTQFNTASLHRHIQKSYHFDVFGGGFVDVLSAEQTEGEDDWYQGTADAVRRNLIHFRNSEHDLVLILSGDQLYRMDYAKLIEQHFRTRADVTIAAIPFPASKVEDFGLMRINDDLSIAEFVEKPKDPEVIERFVMPEGVASELRQPSDEKRCLASMGIYLFNRDVLYRALNNQMTDFGKEVIPSLLERTRLFSYVFEGYWEDIGTVRSFFEANLAITDDLPPFNFFDSLKPIYTHGRYLPAVKVNRCRIDHAVVGDGSILTDVDLTRCVIGLRSLIREECRLESVVVMGADYYESEAEKARNADLGRPDIGLGRNTRIRQAIIDKNARIGDNVRLSPEGRENGFARDGVVIRDGVLIVTKDSVIPNGTAIWPEDP